MIFGTKSVASVIGAFTKVLDDLKEVASNSENTAATASTNSTKVREKADQQIAELAQTAKSALEEKDRANAIILKLEELFKVVALATTIKNLEAHNVRKRQDL